MKIKKKEQSVGLLGKIVNLLSNSKQDTYSCNYINTKSKELQDSIPTKTSQLINDAEYARSISITLESIDNFKNFAVNNAPIGVTLYNFWTSGGANSAIILQKANNNYLSFLQFGYGKHAVQYLYQNGNWTAKEL